MMWSIGLIVGVAATASLVMLAVGVTLAISIERRRYRKYMERHTAGASMSTHNESIHSIEELSHAVPERTSRRMSALQNSTQTWITLPSSESILEQVETQERPVTVNAITPGNKTTHETLKGTVKKKSAGRRRLKRIVPPDKVKRTPLAAITEDVDYTQPRTQDASPDTSLGTSQNSVKTPNIDLLRWELSVPKKREILADKPLMRTNSTGPSLTNARPVCFRRSVSLTDTLVPVPTDPLPPLPRLHHPNETVLLKNSYISHSSLESIGSSLLNSATSSPARSIFLTEVTQSQGLQEFDFGLDPVTRLKLPDRLVSVDKELSIVTGERDFKVPVDTRTLSGEISSLHADKKCHSSSLHPTFDRYNDAELGSGVRNCLFNSGRASPVGKYPQVLIASDGKSDPFVEVIQEGSSSVKKRPISHELGCATNAKRTSIDPNGSGRGHKRQNCVRISDLPLAPPTSMTYRSARTSDPEKRSNAFNLSVRHDLRQLGGQGRRGDFDSTTRFSEMELNSTSTTTRESGAERGDVTSSIASIPEAPEPDCTPCWQFDLIPPDTPQARGQTSPLRFHNSPVLPPPTISSAHIFPSPRRSQVRGPRSPRAFQGPSRSPPRPRAGSSQTKNHHLLPRSSIKKHVEPAALYRTIALLRQMSSESQLANSTVVDVQVRGDIKSHEASWNTKITQPVLKATASTLSLLAVPMQTLKASGSTAHSSANDSADETSIWEDISVRDESPMPSPNFKLRPLSPVRSNLSNVGESIRSSSGTPRTGSSDYEAYENFVETYGKEEPSKASSQHRRNSRYAKEIVVTTGIEGMGLEFD